MTEWEFTIHAGSVKGDFIKDVIKEGAPMKIAKPDSEPATIEHNSNTAAAFDYAADTDLETSAFKCRIKLGHGQVKLHWHNLLIVKSSIAPRGLQMPTGHSFWYEGYIGPSIQQIFESARDNVSVPAAPIPFHTLMHRGTWHGSGN